ncbi:MAG: hypothetical protein QXV44_03705 [Candidatus Anstonellaceae archaeon]
MKFKYFFAGGAFLYGLILLLSLFNFPVVFYIPISIAGVDLGKLITALLLFLAGFFLLKR